MNLVTYNIQYGLGADGRYDLARIAGEVAGADVIALQEVDRFWRRSGMVDGPEVLADALPRHHWVYGANLDMDASQDDGTRVISRRKQFGTMILSRWRILSSRNHLLPKWGDRLHHSIQQGMLEAVIATPRGPIRFYSAHLSHLGAATRLPQVEAIRAILARAPAEGGAWCGGHPDPDSGWIEETEPPMPAAAILMGDLNFTHDSAEYAALCGPVVPRHGRLCPRDGLVDAWVAAGQPEASGATTLKGGTRIDHCLLTPDLAPQVRAARIDTDSTGSDHWPLWVTLG